MKYTKTSTFIFPFLGIDRELFKCEIKNIFGQIKFETRFINAYLRDENLPDYTDHVFVVTRNYRDVDFAKFYDQMVSFPNYVDDYEFGNICVFIFTILPQWEKDYKIILEGKYSQISEEASKQIRCHFFFSGAPSLIPLILYKENALKKFWEDKISTEDSPCDLGDQEVWPIITLESDTLTSKIKQKFATKNALTPSREFD